MISAQVEPVVGENHAEMVLSARFVALEHLKADFLPTFSFGGVFVRTPLPFSVGQLVSVYLSVPGILQTEKVEAEVRWVNNRGVGLAFNRPPPALQVKLDGLRAAAAGKGPLR
jgi:Tfp pilus assembly protein PilZ